MKQRVFGRKSSRERGARQALLRSLLGELFRHGKIKTTRARAKRIQRSSGFTRIINLGKRKGDRAPLSILELIKPEDKNES